MEKDEEEKEKEENEEAVNKKKIERSGGVGMGEEGDI